MVCVISGATHSMCMGILGRLHRGALCVVGVLQSVLVGFGVVRRVVGTFRMCVTSYLLVVGTPTALGRSTCVERELLAFNLGEWRNVGFVAADKVVNTDVLRYVNLLQYFLNMCK